MPQHITGCQEYTTKHAVFGAGDVDAGDFAPEALEVAAVALYAAVHPALLTLHVPHQNPALRRKNKSTVLKTVCL